MDDLVRREMVRKVMLDMHDLGPTMVTKSDISRLVDMIPAEDTTRNISFYDGMRTYKRICEEVLFEAKTTMRTKVLFQTDILEKAAMIFHVRDERRRQGVEEVYLK